MTRQGKTLQAPRGEVGGMDGVCRVIEWAREHLGLLWDPSAESEIRRKLVSAARARGHEDVDEFVQHLFKDLTAEDRLRTLAPVLTIGETYFFRELEALETFRQEVLPEILRFRHKRGQRHLYVWSAGCSTGEEAYSLAMILKEALHGHAGWDFSILATDINEKALQTAREGLYRAWSFRKPVPLAYGKYVVKQEDENLWRVSEVIRRHVVFSVLNLASDRYPSALTRTTDVDAVFCRNVLMYFDPKTREDVLGRFHEALNEEGWLVLSASEVHTASCGPWEPVRHPGAIFLRKGPVAAFAQSKETLPARKSSSQSVLLSGNTANFPLSPRTLRGWALGNENHGSVPREADGKGRLLDLAHGASGPIRPPRDASGAKAVHEPNISPGKQAGQPFGDREISCLLGSGRLDDAVRLVEQCLDEAENGQPDHGLRDEVMQVAHALTARGLGEEALKLLDRALAVSKFDPVYHHMKGALHADRGEVEKAVTAFRQMLYVAPQSATALLSLGMLCRRDGHGEAARRYLEGALKLLHGKDEQEEVPYSDGMSVGQTRRMIEQFLEGIGER